MQECPTNCYKESYKNLKPKADIWLWWLLDSNDQGRAIKMADSNDYNNPTNEEPTFEEDDEDKVGEEYAVYTPLTTDLGNSSNERAGQADGGRGCEAA